MHLLIVLGVTAFQLSQISAQVDEYEYFRCDACSATFFKINQTFIQRRGHKFSMPAYEFMEILENICETMFTKHEYGTKQYEGKKYLFGPGVIDHIPDKGFGQMGMGDYDQRLSSYCRMFIEEIGEDELHRLFLHDGGINKTQLCTAECASSASGTGAQSGKPRRQKRRTPPSPPPGLLPKKTKVSPRPPPSKRPDGLPSSRTKIDEPPKPLPASTPVASAEFLEKIIGSLPNLSPMQLRWLGEAVISELAKRATKLPPVDGSKAEL